MNIRIPDRQRKWLEAQVAAGRFESIDEAITVAVSDLMLVGEDDLGWAKPYVDEGLEAAARGQVVPLEDALRDMKAHLASLKK